MLRRILLASFVGLIALGCSAAPAGTPIIIYVTPEPTATPVATATVGPTPSETVAPTANETVVPTPTARPTARPTPRVTLAPAQTANASKDDPVLLTWSSSGYVTAQIITSVVNTGGTWIELDQYDSNWTLYDPDGGVLTTRSYLDAVGPRWLAPGETAYAVAEEFTDDYRPADFDRAEMEIYYDEARDGDGQLEVAGVNIRRGSLDGVEVTGQISNPGTVRVDSASVLAIFLDASGAPLGFASGYADNIEPGGTRAFEISSTFAEIPLRDIDKTLVFASSGF